MTSNHEDAIESALMEFHQAWSSDSPPDVDEFCDRHPECKEALRIRIEDFLYVARGLSEAGQRFEEDVSGKVGEPAGTMLGGFRIIKEIGRGGMGVVYEAEQRSPRRRVALKMIGTGVFSRSLLKRFQFEAEVLGLLKHPGIAQIYEAGEMEYETGSQPYFAMEYVEGLGLLAYAKEYKLGVREKLELIARIADAVQHAHQKGIVHRDLKPDNVLVVGEPAATAAGDAAEFARLGQPKVLDFGVARATDADVQMTTLQTDVGQLVGTISYMSPEQVEGDSLKLDVRSDIYALGVMLYELLAGRPPFDLATKSVPQAVRIIREEEPTRLGSIDTEFRGDIDTIACKALEKDRDRRYPSAADLAADLRRHLANEPITAHPPSTFYELKKFARRHKGLVAGLVLAFLILVAGIISSLAFSWRAVQNERRALTSEESARSAAHRLSVMAAQALGDTDPVRAMEHLQSVPPDCRGWEWRHMHARFRSHAAEFMGSASHDGRADFLGHRPTGEFVAAFERNGNIELVDLATGEGEVVLRDAHDWTLLNLSTDASRMVMLHEPEDRVRVWDISTGKWFLDLPMDQERPKGRYQYRLSPDGSLLVTATRSKVLTAIEVSTGRALNVNVQISPWQSIWQIVFDHEGERYAVGSDIWLELISKTGVSLARERVMEPVRALAFSPDGTRLAVGYNQRMITIHDSASLETLNVLYGHSEDVQAVGFSPDGKYLASASQDGTVRIWDLASQRTLRVLIGFPSGCSVPSLDFSRNGELLAVGKPDGVRLWAWKEDAARRLLDPPDRYIYHVDFSPDSALVASGSFNEYVRLWDAWTGEHLSCRETGGSRLGMGFTPDGYRLISVSGQGKWAPGKIHVCDTVALKCLTAPRLPADEALFESLYGDAKKSILYVVAGGGKEITYQDQRHASNADASLMAKGHPTGEIHILDTDSGEMINRINGHGADIFSLAFSPNGKHLATANAGGVVEVWDHERSVCLVAKQGHIGNVYSVRYSPDATRIASGGNDGSVILWDAETLEQVAVFREHTSYVHSVAFSPDGTLLASGSGDGTARIWDALPPAERRLQVLEEEKRQREAAPHVDRLLDELKDPLDVADFLRTDESLSEEVRRAALRVLLER